MLRSLELLHVYDSAEHDLVRDLVVPLLNNSREYYRGVGFFTSGWLRLASQGLVSLVENGGAARVVLSPILEAGDWDALQVGENAKLDACLRRILERKVVDLQHSLEADTLNALAWLVADERLEFRFAVPRDKESVGDYHDKVAVFIDEKRDVVAIHGSYNDTVKGTINGEAFSVFKSWDSGQLAFVKSHYDRLLTLWEEGNRQFAVRTIPEAVRDQFIRLRSSRSRPYTLPGVPSVSDFVPRSPHCPVMLRPFQHDAVTAWESNGFRGLLEMATGSGKTITALAAAVRRYEASGRLAVMILVPYLHLIEQWAGICSSFGFLPTCCSSAHTNWRIKTKSLIQDFRLGGISTICILAVHDTAASEAFLALTKGLPADATLVIADEAHALGAEQMRPALASTLNMRLGLSATPRRWFDEAGTQYLLDYFGGVVFEYPLEKAIGECLVPYDYYPVPIELSSAEEQQFAELTARIAALRGRAADDPEAEEMIKNLLLRRARIISDASGKISGLLSLLRREIERLRMHREELRNTLIYCGPGTHRDILREVSQLEMRCHEFVHTVSLPARQELLRQFAHGDIQALVAIKCLDEGVDVPSTEVAFFLASTTNPREFVQRRGRVLRRSPGKHKAVLHDFIVVPSDTTPMEVAQSLLRREMPRFVEFASLALNEFQARSVVRAMLDRYELLNLLDERPWDVYHALRAAREVSDAE